MHNIQSTAYLSRQCIQFTRVRVQNNTSSLYPLDISSKTQVAFLIASEYYGHVWSDVQSLYIITEVSRMLQNQIEVNVNNQSK